MLIVVEGMDNTGKTTLAHRLAKDLGGVYIKSEIHPKTNEEVTSFHRLTRRIDREFATVIFDRHHSISGPIYDEVIRKRFVLDPKLMQEIRQQLVVVYCRPSTHRILYWGDPTSQMDGVVENAETLLDHYDRLDPGQFANFYPYNFEQDDYSKLCKRLMATGTNNFRDVVEFHRKFNLYPQSEIPALLDPDLYWFRVKFLEEELKEFINSHQAGDLHGAADALIDLAYVVFGTAYLMNLPWQELWDRVHRANMKKVRAASADQSKRGSACDVVKPAGWEPPSFEDLL